MDQVLLVSVPPALATVPVAGAAAGALSLDDAAGAALDSDGAPATAPGAAPVADADLVEEAVA